jgi:mannose-6-phosphate isomerase-like protein (cupin superfamily)
VHDDRGHAVGVPGRLPVDAVPVADIEPSLPVRLDLGMALPQLHADIFASATISTMSYHVARGDEHEYEERPFVEGQPPRLQTDVTTAAALQRSRARLWRYPPRTRGRRHADRAQEEVFVVVSGTLTMLLGDPPERFDLPPLSVVAVEPGTPLQARNEADEELVLFIYGAPPEQEGAEMLDDPGDL